MKFVWMNCLLFGLCLLNVGCGGSNEPVVDETTEIDAIVTSVNDAAGSEQTFKEIFVGGNAPEERNKYFSAIIEPVGTPEVSGNEATQKIKISQGAAEEEGRGAEESEEIASGEVTWTLQKAGEIWKLKDAPLP